MAKEPYCFAPEEDEPGWGTVKVADDRGVWHTFDDMEEAREFLNGLQSAIEVVEESVKV